LTKPEVPTAKIDELLDDLMKNYKKPEDIIGDNWLLKQLTKAILERTMKAELTDHLGYTKPDPAGKNSGNSWIGNSKKTIMGEFGSLEIKIPRDRNATFEPVIISKRRTRFSGLDDEIIPMYVRGMITRDIQTHLQELYGVDVSATLISRVIDAVTDEITLCQNRPLEEVYPIIYMDAIRVKVRDNDAVINKDVSLCIVVTWDGTKDILGMWIAETEGAKFWLQVVTELKNRGVRDIFIVCVDVLKGFPKASEAVFPKAQVQFCIVIWSVTACAMYLGSSAKKLLLTSRASIMSQLSSRQRLT
jgi:putative transposase